LSRNHECAILFWLVNQYDGDGDGAGSGKEAQPVPEDVHGTHSQSVSSSMKDEAEEDAPDVLNSKVS